MGFIRSALPGSVRARLVLLVAGITTLALALGYILLKGAESGQRRLVSQQLAIGSRAIATAVDLQLARYVSMLDVLAQSRSLREDDLAGFERTARRVTERDKVWVALTDLSGGHIVNTGLEPDEFAPPFDVPPSLSDALAAGETYISNLTSGLAGKLPALFVARKVYDKYILRVEVSPAAFGERLAIPKMAPDGTVAIVDRAGIIMVRNRAADRFVGTPATGSIAELIAGGKEGIVESVTKDEIPVLTSCSRAACGWTALVALPRTEIYSVIEQLFRRAMLLSALLVLLALAMAHLLARGVVEAVHALVRGSESLAERQPISDDTTGLAETDLVLESMRQASNQIRQRETERDRAEEQLRRAHQDLATANAELEQRVDERTRRLRQTIEELETFSYSIAHDMRAPLRSMRSFSEILSSDYQDRLDRDGHDYLQRISVSAERLDRLLLDVLKLSRLAREEIPVSPVDAHQLLENIIDSYPNFQQRRACITVQGRLPAVVANESALTQCFSNLLANALKFAKAGATPEVRIWSEMRNGRARIFIKDNGIGIPANCHERIFRVFEQLEKDPSGTGIGLAIVKRSVERMGGAVAVESVPGEGSTFSIELPAA